MNTFRSYKYINKYEEEYLENILEEPVIEPRSANGESQAAMQSQKVGIGKDDKCAEGDSLPLCYSSFELIQHMIKASKQNKKEMEMTQTRSLCKKEEDKKNQPGDSSYATSILEICIKGQAMKIDVAASK